MIHAQASREPHERSAQTDHYGRTYPREISGSRQQADPHGTSQPHETDHYGRTYPREISGSRQQADPHGTPQPYETDHYGRPASHASQRDFSVGGGYASGAG